MRKFLLLISVALMSAVYAPNRLQAQSLDGLGYVFKDGYNTFFITSENTVILTFCQDPSPTINIPETATHPFTGKTFNVNAICEGQIRFADATSTYSTEPFKGGVTGNPRSYEMSGPFASLQATEIHLPKTVTDITKGCPKFTNLGTIAYSSSSTSILYGLTTNRVAITIDEENPQLEVVDGVVYDKINNWLELYPTNLTATTYTVREGTTKIVDYAFSRRLHESTGDGVFCNLETVNLPSTIKEIGNYAFSYNRNLSSISLPEGLTNIGKRAFEMTTSLPSITFPQTLTVIGMEAFAQSALTSVDVPGSVKTISTGCFRQNYFMTTATLHSGTTKIDNFAFSGNRKLTSISLPEGLETIERGAISACYKLPSITIPSSVTKIGDYAFMHNRKMTTINIPANATLSKGVFTCCTNLENITIDGGTRYQMDNDGGKLDKGVLYGNSNNVANTMDELVFFIPKNNISASNSSLIKQWIVPNSVRKICAGSIGENNIESLVLPSELTIIEELAFFRNYYSSLSSPENDEDYLSLNEKKEIWNTYKMKELTIPAKVTSLHLSAFYQTNGGDSDKNDSRIEKLYFMGKPTIEKAYSNSVGEAYNSSFVEGTNADTQTNRYQVGQTIGMSYNYKNITVYTKESLYDTWSVTEKGYFNNHVSYEIPLRDAQVGENKVSSMCRDFDMDFSNATGVSAYIATSYDASVNEGAGGYKMQKVNYVPSRTGTENDEYHGVIIRMEDPSAVVTYRIGENDYNSDSPQVAFKDASDANVETTANRLVGVVVNSHVQGTEDGLQTWGLSSGKWQRIVNTGKLTPYNRAYLKPTASETNSMTGKGGQNAKIAMSFVDDDNETTGIKNVGNNNVENTESDHWYTISGQRLYGTPTEKGIYIHNGKKEIIR